MRQAVCDLCGKTIMGEGGGKDALALCRDCHERGQIWASIQAYKEISGIDRHSVLDRFEKLTKGKEG